MRPPRGFGVACGPEPRMSVGGAVGEDEGGGSCSLSGEKPQRSPLPATVGASPGQIAVYDLFGRRVAIPVDGQKNAGRSQFQFRTQDLAGGTYILRLQAADQTRTQ